MWVTVVDVSDSRRCEWQSSMWVTVVDVSDSLPEYINYNFARKLYMWSRDVSDSLRRKWQSARVYKL
jgi:hypothetical protein